MQRMYEGSRWMIKFSAIFFHIELANRPIPCPSTCILTTEKLETSCSLT
jgi:hypothetical protein